MDDLETLKAKAEKWDKHQQVLDELKKTKNKAIKKTLTIPEWLNDEAQKYDINFSYVLQEALKEKLGL